MLKSYRLLGIKITPSTKEELIEFVASCVEDGSKRVIASQNLHGMYVSLTNHRFQALHEDERTIVHIDGTPIIWLGRLLGIPLRNQHRTAWVDWYVPLMNAAAQRHWRVYYLGSEPEVLEEGLRRVNDAVPGLAIAGHHGFFDARPASAENAAVVKEINAWRTDVLIVGMGMGRQEQWILDNLDQLEVSCIGTSGALMEVIAGKLSIPPRWMGTLGIEWLYRLWKTPRRVAHRYLVEPWLLAWLILRNQVRTYIASRRCQ